MINPLSIADLLDNRKLTVIIENLMNLTDNPIGIFDLEHHLILGQVIATAAPEYPIKTQQNIIGWVKGEKVAQVFAQLLTYLANQQMLVFFDDLTQIPNRRYFDLYFQQEWLRSQRENLFLSLLLCDLDHFKFYNDHYGHQTGDLCLQQVAQALNTVVKRSSDLLFRYGGEEFAIILPNTNSKGAQIVAQQLVSAISQLKISHPTSLVDAYLTISMGVATVIPREELNKEDLLKAADIALYQAKEKGRNGYYFQIVEPLDHNETEIEE